MARACPERLSEAKKSNGNLLSLSLGKMNSTPSRVILSEVANDSERESKNPYNRNESLHGCPHSSHRLRRVGIRLPTTSDFAQQAQEARGGAPQFRNGKEK